MGEWERRREKARDRSDREMLPDLIHIHASSKAQGAVAKAYGSGPS
jgi:hypothetical protein